MYRKCYLIKVLIMSDLQVPRPSNINARPNRHPHYTTSKNGKIYIQSCHRPCLHILHKCLMPQYFPLLPFSFLGVTKCPPHYCTSCSALLICCSRSLPLAFASCSNARARASTCWLMIQTTGHHEQPQGLVVSHATPL